MVYFKYALRKHELYQIKKEKIGSKRQRSYSFEHTQKKILREWCNNRVHNMRKLLSEAIEETW